MNAPNRDAATEDRFACRREGHVPALTITSANPIPESYICPCLRCGKLVEFPFDPYYQVAQEAPSDA